VDLILNKPVTRRRRKSHEVIDKPGIDSKAVCSFRYDSLKLVDIEDKNGLMNHLQKVLIKKPKNHPISSN